MKFYKFKIYDHRKIKTDSLPFNSKEAFFKYLKINNLKLITYKVTHKNYKPGERDILLFTQHLISLLKSGIGITLSLEIIAAQENKNFAHIINTIKNDIITGESIHSSFAQYKDVFNDTYLNLLNAGEKSGNLSKNLSRIYDNLKLVTSFKEKTKKSILYPAIVGLFTLMLIIFLFLVILPDFETFFDGSGIELPFLTKLLLDISKNSLTILIITTVFILLIIITFNLLPIEKKEKIKFTIPIIGKILYKDLIINFTQNFFIMLESGISVPDALESLKTNCKYSFFKKYITTIQINIRHGQNVHDSFENINFFKDQHLKLIAIGEQTGNLAHTFETISIVTQKQLEEILFKITTMLQPVLLTFLGIIIGIIIFAIYLPVFNMSDIIL